MKVELLELFCRRTETIHYSIRVNEVNFPVQKEAAELIFAEDPEYICDTYISAAIPEHWNIKVLKTRNT